MCRRHPELVDGDNNANSHSKSIVRTPNPSVSIPRITSQQSRQLLQQVGDHRVAGRTRRSEADLHGVGQDHHHSQDSTNKTSRSPRSSSSSAWSRSASPTTIKGANGLAGSHAFKDVASDPFFSKGRRAGRGRGPASPHRDPHLPERPPGVRALQNPANSQIYAENVWGKAMGAPTWTSGAPTRPPTRPSGASRPSSRSGGEFLGSSVASTLVTAKSGGIFSGS